MKPRTKELLLKLFVAVALTAILWVLMAPPAHAQARLKWYRDYQESVEYPAWIKSQPKTRIHAIKAAVSQSKETNSKRKKNNKFTKKEARLRKQIKQPIES